MADLVERLLEAAKRRGAAGSDSAVDSQLTAVLAVLAADYGPWVSAPQAADAAAGNRSAAADVLGGVAEVFGLDDSEAELLAVAAAPDLDTNAGLAFGLLRATPGSTRASVGLALELTGLPSLGPAGFSRLGPGSPLRRHRLIEVLGSDPWLSRTLRVPDSVVSFLAGSDQPDPVVEAMRLVPVPMDLPQTATVSAGVRSGVPLTWVTATPAAAGASLATSGFAALGLRSLTVDARRCPSGEDLLGALGAAARDAGLRGAGLVVVGAEVLGEPGASGALELLEGAAVPVVAVGARDWNPSWLRRLPLVLEAQPLSAASRASVWQAALGDLAGSDEELRTALVGLRLPPEDVVETARYAKVLAASRQLPLSAPLVREAARKVGGSGGAGTSRIASSGRAGAGPTFDDLILPDHAKASLRQLVSWARHRDQVTARGPLRSKGNGIAALLTGSPGTGKTLAANVIAEELAIDLFQVDLSAIVDKYIGETEKNLERVFQSAEALDVVLFFDEADALFGSRSEVRDSRDRYANQEVAYLLQRMENFNGITLLATNLRGNLDPAFSRRLSFIVHFPDPDAATRRLLWRSHLDQLDGVDPDDAPDLDFLAASVELAGGDVRNIVLAAAYDAISSGGLVGMRQLAAAAVAEYRKLGRRVPEHAFLPR